MEGGCLSRKPRRVYGRYDVYGAYRLSGGFPFLFSFSGPTFIIDTFPGLGFKPVRESKTSTGEVREVRMKRNEVV